MTAESIRYVVCRDTIGDDAWGNYPTPTELKLYAEIAERHLRAAFPAADVEVVVRDDLYESQATQGIPSCDDDDADAAAAALEAAYNEFLERANDPGALP